MIFLKDGKLKIGGIAIEIMAEYAFLTSVLAELLRKNGVRDAEKRIMKAVNKGLYDYPEIKLADSNAEKETMNDRKKQI